MSNKGKKKCRSCKTYFTPKYSTLQTVCGYECSVVYSKKKKEQERQELRKARKEVENSRAQKKQTQKLSQQIQLTRSKVHSYIHARDKGKPCITCGQPLKESFDAGHYYHGLKSNALRFDLDNIHGQCIQCNRRNYGMFEKYTLNLPIRIGQERFQSLQERYNDSLKTIHKWHEDDLKAIRVQVTKLKKELIP